MIRQGLASVFALSACCVAHAAVAVINNDAVAYEFKVQCKSDPEPVDEWVDPRGVVDLQNGPCSFVFNNGQSIVVPDKETIVISNGKVALQ